MSVLVAQWLLGLLGLYLALGALFSVPFLLSWVRRIDPAAREGTLGFRVLILPGTVALWPLLLRRVLAGLEAPPEERSPHRRAARLAAAADSEAAR